MMAALMLASMAAAPRLGPTVRCSSVSTGTGRAPARISRARSLAWSAVKSPVMTVRPPTMPVSQAMLGSTCGLDRTWLSSTIATRRAGSPGWAQAAVPVSLAQPSPPPRNSSATSQRPVPCGSSSAEALLTSSPARPVGPIRTGAPSSSFRSRAPLGSSPAGARTGWKVSCAVRPMTSSASRGSETPGSSTMIRRSPERWRLGSDTPSWSTRRRRTSNVRSMVSPVTATPSAGRASSTIWVPPRRSRPRRAGWVTVRKMAPAMVTTTSSRRHPRWRDMYGCSSSDDPARPGP